MQRVGRVMSSVVRGARVAAILLALSAPAAFAEDPPPPIAYQGEVDTAGPLVMDTSNADDPLTLDLNTIGGAAVVMIQRMPVTKTITDVTLGDFAIPSSCATATTLKLVVRSNGQTGFGGGIQLTYSTNAPGLSTTPSRVGWHLHDVVTLLAGKAYTFAVEATGCTTVLQTTWAHNSPKLEAAPADVLGTNKCQTSVPWSAAAGLAGPMRMWHSFGENDRTTLCANWPPSGWSADMPTGWLDAVTYNGDDWYVRTFSRNDSDPASAGHSCSWVDSLYSPRIGAVERFWRTRPDSSYSDYVCIWPLFYDYGVSNSRYGWWYAVPLRSERNGSNGTQARAMYVKLDTIDYDGALQRYAPVLKVDTRDPYRVQSPDGITTVAGAACSGDSNGSNALYQGATLLVSAGPCLFPALIAPFTLGILGPDGGTYPSDAPTENVEPIGPSDHFDERDNYQADSQAIGSATSPYGQTIDDNRVYGRAVQDASGTMWLQYWFWYYYNDGDAVLGGDNHEGDWENIQLRIPMSQLGNLSSASPDRATYAHHDDAGTCSWSAVETSDGHPVVYVSLGRHASWFSPYTMIGGDTTNAEPSSTGVQAQVSQIHSYVPWIRWPGSWGELHRRCGRHRPKPAGACVPSSVG
jgi:hypothetical protein